MRIDDIPGYVKAAVAALAILAPGAALAQAGAVVACEVNGYDVIILNEGTEAFAAGTVLRWSVPFARRDGELTLTDALGPGEREFLTGALGSSFLGSGTACESSVG